MFEIIVIACLATDPGTCTPQKLGVVPDASQGSCQINSRQRLSAWARSNPALLVADWHCEPIPANE